MKKIYEKEEGIASTVGTIFALMIFTSLLGMFMTQVVPVTMKENEAQHDQEVISQLSTLRSMVDLLTLTKDTNYTAYVPIKLGADGIPFFASPTYGQLGLYPFIPNGSTSHMLSFKFTDKYGNVIWANSSGSLQFVAPNKYYDSEIFEYADGAIMRYNYMSNASIFAINPNLKFESQDLGYALNFSGDTSAYVSVPDSSSLDVTGPVTIEFWAYIKEKAQQTFVIHNKYYTVWMHSNGAIRFADTFGDYVDTAPLPSSDYNRWIHIAAVFSGHTGDPVNKNNTQIYINGKPAGISWGGTWRAGSTTATELYIGKNGYDGYMDELRILNRALTQDDILSDYYAGHYYPTRRGTVAWYHFDEGNAHAGSVVIDSSGNGNNGTVNSDGVSSIKIDGVNVGATLQNIFGTPDVISGTDTRSIGVSLQGVYSQSYNIGGSLNITVKDYYKYVTSYSLNFTKCWISAITDMLNQTGLSYGVDYTVRGNTITIYYVNNADLNMVYLIMNIER